MWSGMEMAQAFYEECGQPMIRQQFGLYEHQIAAGLAGQTSECYGYDDWISRDHDFAPGFCLWIPESLRDTLGSALQSAYDALPVQEFVLRHRIDVAMAPGEGLMTGARQNRVGVHSIEEFFYEHTGMTRAPQTPEDWLRTPQMHLAEAVNGKVFADPSGAFSAIREVWAAFYPLDVLKKKVAANCAMAAKTGQFNYDRCLRRGDQQAANACCTEFVYKAMAALFLLNGRYMPYYKWRWRAMQEFTVGAEAVPLLAELTQLPESEHQRKISLIEQVCYAIRRQLVEREWSWSPSDYLLDHAKQVMTTIEDPQIASWNIFVGED